MDGWMKIRLGVKPVYVLLLGLLLLTQTGCSQAIISPIDRLATLRPVLTPAIGGGGEPFVPLSEDATPESQITPVPEITSLPTLDESQTTPADPNKITLTPTGEPNQAENPLSTPPILYYTQAGDTLQALGFRFGVKVEEMTSPEQLSPTGFLNPGQLILIPKRLKDTSNAEHIIPDSEIFYSPSALDFDLDTFINGTNGYLSTYKEWHTNGRSDPANAIYRVAIENSINPRLLLAILEYQSGWVYGQPQNLAQTDFPAGYINYSRKGLYYQLAWAVQNLNIGYYGWRDGRITSLTFIDGQTVRLAPDLNAGSVALFYLFSQLYDKPNWARTMYGPESLPALYERMFGSPWQRAQTVEPLFPSTLTQPTFTLPFLPGIPWSFTGGPHSAWGKDGALAALDFAPSTTEHGCNTSQEFATSIADGLVVRSEPGAVVVDLDGDGYEQTGWAILYLHMATQDRVPLGTWVNTNDPIGHPSCEGGQSTGTHLHIARKYNGEWIQADGPLPFIMEGWRTHKGEKAYEGWLTKDDKVVESSVYGEFKSLISR
jgi:LasA protease